MKRNEGKNHGAVRAGLLALVLLPASLLLAQPARAQDERAERELEAARQKVRQLMQESEELRHKAEQLQEKIAEHMALRERREHARRERGRGEDAELVEILESLEHGMVALERLGKHDLRDMLGRAADEVRAKRRALHGEREVIGIGAAPGRRRSGNESRSEREVAMHQLEVMRIALHALLEAERGDTAELLERAIRAREVNLEGHRDEEALAIRERAPDLGQLTEILLYSAKLWDEFGHEKKAAEVRELGEQFHAKFRRAREAGQREEARAHRDRARSEREVAEQRRVRAERARAEARDRRDETVLRIERLEGRLERVEGMLEEMHEMLQSFRRRDR